MKSLIIIVITVIFSNVLIALNPRNSYLCLIEFRKDKIELDSNQIVLFEGLISAINNDTNFCKKYEILFTPYNLKSEYLNDKKIGVKRFNYLQEIIQSKTNKKCR